MSLPVNSLYSLTWGDYGTSLVSAVQLLRCHGDLVDVTLAAGGRSFQAHKIVLCAASPYLLELLKNTSCKHPIVMLAGVSANDLEALLEFVYRGEVSVDHSQLPSLLQAAHCLNIQGLAPQTVTHKDDTAYTSIQIHPSLIQQDVKTHIMDVDGMQQNEEFILSSQPTQQQVQTQIVEEVIEDPLNDDVTKDVINQFLPQRKRKPRAKKSPSAKVIKLEQPSTSAITPTTSATVMATTSQQAQQTQQVQIQQQQQGQVVQHVQEEVVQMQEIIEGEEIIGEVDEQQQMIKTEGKPLPQTPTQSSGDTSQQTPMQSTPVSIKSEKTPKPKAKSQSEQPATCPICSAVIRQSRNLRRHLELRHFKKRTPKKETEGGVQSVEPQAILSDSPNGQQNNTITVTMAPNSEQQTITVNGQQQGQHVLTQHENPDGTTSLAITQVGGIGGTHQIIGSLNNATIIRAEDGQPIEGNIITTPEGTFRSHTELFRVGSTVYTIEERRPEPNRMN